MGCDPTEMGERLFLVDGKKRFYIGSMKDLAEHLKIENSDQALAVVRLRTSFRTFYMLNGDISLEPVERCQLTTAMTYGDAQMLRWLQTGSEGFMGVLNDGRMEGLRTPFVTKSKVGWRIERIVAFGMNGAIQACRRTETVTSDGTYRFMVDSRISNPWKDVRFFAMTFQ